MRRAVEGFLLAVVIAAAVTTAPALGVVAPYGTNDAGGFRNVLPAGEAGTDNAAQLVVFEAAGQRPDTGTTSCRFTPACPTPPRR